jgi:hypothetical protein
MKKASKMRTGQKPDTDALVAKAYLISFPHLVVFALVFAAIGGIGVWTSQATSNHTSLGGKASLIASPSPASPGSVVSFSGCGYLSTPASLVISGPDNYVTSNPAAINPGGCIVGTTWSVPYKTGGYTASIYQASSPHSAPEQILESTAAVIVR